MRALAQALGRPRLYYPTVDNLTAPIVAPLGGILLADDADESSRVATG